MGRLARRAGAVDHPTEQRRMHSLATPLLGGLGIYIAWVVPVLLLVPLTRPIWGLVSGASIIVAVGLFDDLFELEPIIKFTGQLLAIAVALYFGVRVTRIAVPFVDEFLMFPGALSLVVTAMWMAAVINMVNFIDGLDGLAAGVCGISADVQRDLHSTASRARRVAAVWPGPSLSALQLPPGEHLHGRRRSMLLGHLMSASERDEGHGQWLCCCLLVLGVPFIDLFLIVWRRWHRGAVHAAGTDHAPRPVWCTAFAAEAFSSLTRCLLLNGLAMPCSRTRRGDRGPGHRRRRWRPYM
jgi:UDP-GlcNAc:undecaprenyl-phosphate GlcNAc-1-phosphate transferase